VRAAPLALVTAGACGALVTAAEAQAPGAIPRGVLRPDTAGAGLIASAAASPRSVAVRDAGPGLAGRLLRDALAGPHLLVVAPDTGLTLGRDVRAGQTLVVVGGPVRLASMVRGDVLVLGELFLRPGADVTGRAIAIGGGAYNSTLARVGGGLLAYREIAFAARPDGAGGIALDVRPGGARRDVPRLSLPGTVGLRLPSYTRVDGLAVTVGPELALDTGRVRIEPLVTYRSQLGVVDPGVHAVAELTRRTVVELRAERGTFTNDAWARGDLVNAIVFAGTGADARNYYRADRGELTVLRRYETETGVVEPLVGALVERAWSAARDSATSRPFTLFGRDDLEGARRVNPAVTGGRITSALVGMRVRREIGDLRGRAEARVEQALAVERGGRFTRATVDVAFERGARDERQLYLFAHAALTAGRDVPTQRYAYLGGGPTLPTLFLLSQGGTELVWGEARYTVPLPRIRLPVAGAPSIAVRAMAGAAGVGTLPAFTPNLGLRLIAAGLRADVVFDPTGRTRGPQFSVGVGLR